MVIWTLRARAPISKPSTTTSPRTPAARTPKRVAHEIRRKAETLAEPPRIGRKVPELNDPQLREISAYSWRIIYHLREDNVFIVTLIHKRRQPGAEVLVPE